MTEEYELIKDSETGGKWYKVPDGRMAYEKRNGTIIGPTEHDAIRSAYKARYGEEV